MRLLHVLVLALPLCATAPRIVAQPSAQRPGAPSSATDSLLPATTLQHDVALLRTALETVHPGLHRYATAAQVDSLFAALTARLSHPQTRRDAWLAIAEAMARLQCGHTFLNPVNQPDAVAADVFRDTPRVPFYFRWLDARMVVTRDASAERAFPVGTEVVSIDGVPAREILAQLLRYSRADGGNRAKRVANLEVAPEERWAAFDVYFPLLHPPREGAAWRFVVRPPGSRRLTAIAPAPATSAARLAIRDTVLHPANDSAPPWDLATGADSIAVLRMPTWVTFNDHWDWEGFIQRSFDTLSVRRPRALVIDLRGNEGGTNVGDAILAHLVDRDVTLDAFRRYVRYRELPDSLRPFLETWDRSFDHWGAQAIADSARPGFYRLVRAGDAAVGSTVVHPASPRYRGRVFVLVGAANSSATFEFALAAHRLGVATLVGQPTGGNQRGINGGAFYFLTLPGSHIEIDLPIIGFFPDGARPDAGIAPDISVRVTSDDVARGRDPEMAAVRRLLGARR